MPIQPAGARGIRGSVEVLPEFEKGLQGLEGFSHIYLLYWFHLSEGFDLTVKPFMDVEHHGVFATRAPRRPNQIGLSVVRLVAIQQGKLIIEDVDILDGTPLLDIKPFVPEFDIFGREFRSGWLEKQDISPENVKADDRFSG
jgi:tRNA-Thr(GGU) m(6)t(6)A37 methyltransferase TsaA